MTRFLSSILLPAAMATAATVALPQLAQAAAPGCIVVQVHNVRPQQGQLMVAAYLTAESYQKKPAVALMLPAGESTMSFELCGLSGDMVALALFQDLDGDGKMGTNLVGMPTEPWGASGSPGLMGPTWDATRLLLDGQPLVVRLSQ